MRARKRIQTLLKRKKNHVMVMLVCMNAANTSSTQHVNAHAEQMIYPSVRFNRLQKSKNMNMKICEKILLFIIHNQKDVLRIWNRELYIFQEAANITANITAKGISLFLKEKQSGNVKSKK